MNPFPPDAATQIAAHMNNDHADDNLLIVQALGGIPQATAARVTGLDATAMDFAAVLDGIEVPVRVPFAEPLTERSQVRPETIRMYREACTTLGRTPRH